MHLVSGNAKRLKHLDGSNRSIILKNDYIGGGGGGGGGGVTNDRCIESTLLESEVTCRTIISTNKKKAGLGLKLTTQL